MKYHRFKAWNIPSKLKDSRARSEQQKINNSPSPTQQLLEEMQTLLKQALENHEDPVIQGLEYRDRMAKSSLKASMANYEDKNTIEGWIGEVCRNILSTTFRYYLEEDMSFEQAKIYCCQQLLRNISYFAEKHEVTAEFYQSIDKIMKDKIMPYLALKYPLSSTFNANKSLSRIVKEINNIEVLSNDFFYNSNIPLEYRESGNYNDIIMQVLNELISLADSTKGGQEQVTVFKDFDNYITDLFQKVYDPVWMAQKSISNSQSSIPQNVPSRQVLASEKLLQEFKGMQQSQKYRQKVQQYTHYQTSRKIKETVHTYTQDEIKSKHLVIKSPEILRIITKWCEELWEKFTNQNYYIDRSEGLTMLNSKQINILYEWFRLDLKQRLKNQKVKIQKYMSNVEDNLYEQYFSILQSELMSKEAPFLNRYERVCGKFSTKVVDNLKNCIVIYLNRLIHGLMFVSTEAFRTKLKAMASWTAPPNLLSFRIGDLLRCRISSQQKQIVRLYQELHYISQNNPEKLKIIRVKNRLNSGTNDLLINVLYNQNFIAEVQLKVKEKVGSSRFASCSYNFSHFIYEIQRSYFGPISQICSIWSNLDSRTKLYRQLVQNENLNVNLSNKAYSCIKNETQHLFDSLSNSPFICSNCGKSFSSDNYFLTHKKCKICSYYKCALCQIKERQSKDLVNELALDEEFLLNLGSERSESLPAMGICVKIQNNAEGKVNYFKVIELIEKPYVFFLKNNEAFELAEQLKNSKAKEKFIKENIIYQYFGAEPELFKTLTVQKAVKDFIMPRYVKNCYRLEKEAVSLNKISNVTVDQNLLEKMLKMPKHYKKAVKQLEISNQSLVDLSLIPDDFINLQFINVNLNKIRSIESLSRFSKIHTVFCLGNQLTEFPVSLCQLPLKALSIAQNSIKNLPAQFQQVQSLEIVSIAKNSMSIFPLPLTKLKTLKEINGHSNSFEAIPQEIANCTKLTLLKLSQNKISKLPKSIEQLGELQTLDLYLNRIEETNIEFKLMKKLRELNLSKNKLNKIPSSLDECHSLVSLNLSENNITDASFENISLQGISEINLFCNSIKTISHLNSIKSLSVLTISKNKLEVLPEQISQLKNLNHLILKKNLLKMLPECFVQLVNLKKLNLSGNKKVRLPESFSKLKLQTLLMNECDLQEVDPEILALKYLKELNISDNSLKELPTDIQYLKNLQVFEFGNNSIKKIPDQIGSLKNLKKINFKQKIAIELSEAIVAVCFGIISATLYLANSNIEVLPSNIPFNSYLEDINLSSNQIRTIPQSISNLVNLRELNLQNNKLTQICLDVFELKELTKLNLSKNALEQLPDHFDSLMKLIHLDVSSNNLTEIPDSLRLIFSKNFKLQISYNDIITYPLWYIKKNNNTPLSLTLTFRKIKKLPKFQLDNLYKIVTLDHNAFDQFPPEIFAFTNAVELNLSHNQIKEVPPLIATLKHLRKLNLSSNIIEQIPEEMGSLPLTALELQNNPLKTISESFSNLKNMELTLSPPTFHQLSKNNCIQFIKAQSLNLREFQLTSLPTAIQQLTQTQILDISFNKFNVFPEEVFKLSQLKVLLISGQPIKFLPEAIAALKNLTTISASHCRLKQLPNSIAELSCLMKLQVCNNELEILPSNLLKLQILLANANKFSAFPLTIFSYSSLRQLQLSDNRISELPQQIVSSKLCELSMERNLLSAIPEFIKDSKLKKLQVSGNPLKAVENYEAIKEILCGKSREEIERNLLSQK